MTEVTAEVPKGSMCLKREDSELPWVIGSLKLALAPGRCPHGSVRLVSD